MIKPKTHTKKFRHGYTFPDPCVATELPHQYYARQKPEFADDRTMVLPGGVRSCDYEPVPWNRAMVGINGMLRAGTKYGFKVTAIAPYTYDVAQQASWRITILDYALHRIDGVIRKKELLNPCGSRFLKQT